MAKDNRVQLRCPKSFHKVLKLHAAASDMSMTKYMRQLAEKNKNKIGGFIDLKF
jgi:hypothetical protein